MLLEEISMMRHPVSAHLAVYQLALITNLDANSAVLEHMIHLVRQ